jgi:hypothetical protein
MIKNLVLIGVFFVGCAGAAFSSSETPLYVEVDASVPDIGIETEVFMGDAMLQQKVGSFRECFVPKESYQASSFGFQIVIEGGEPACKRSPDDKWYEVFYNGCPNCETVGITYGLELKEKKGKYQLRSCDLTRERCGGKKFKKIDGTAIDFNERFFVQKPKSIQRTIEYAGRSGDILRFVYSEYDNGMARTAFTREFQMDFGESDVIGFKGAILKINEADNMRVVYSVIRNFK